MFMLGVNKNLECFIFNKVKETKRESFPGNGYFNLKEIKNYFYLFTLYCLISKSKEVK